MNMLQDRPKEALQVPVVHPSHSERQRGVPLIVLVFLLLALVATGGYLFANGSLPFLHSETTSQPQHHWVSFHLIGTGSSNIAAIGARVTVKVGENSQVQWVTSPLSSSDQPLTFDVGQFTHIDAVEILWPDKRFARITQVTIDTIYLIKEGEVFP